MLCFERGDSTPAKADLFFERGDSTPAKADTQYYKKILKSKENTKNICKHVSNTLKNKKKKTMKI